MGVTQRRARSEAEPERDYDSDNGRVLEGAELLDRLESDDSTFSDGAIPGDPVTGIAYGVIAGGLIWAIAIVAVVFAV